MQQNPFISFVIAARNDDFGHGFLKRFKVCLNSILAFGKKHNLDFEIVVVEWNPPEEKPKLRDEIEKMTGARGRVRIIQVSNNVHDGLSNPNNFPYFEFLAKNTGIRRARGEYVVAMNSDLFVSEELIRYFASERIKFSHNAFYRGVRYDILGDVPCELTVEEQEVFCRDHIYRIQSMHGEIPVNKREYMKMRLYERFFWFKPEKIFLKLKKIFNKLIGKKEVKHQSVHAARIGNLYIHAGDFMMMGREEWFRFRGYPEVKVDRGIDCYMVIMANVAGMLQVILPYPVYHQEHNRSPQKLRPTAVLDSYQEFREMMKDEKVVLINDDNWGLGNFDLSEDRL